MYWAVIEFAPVTLIAVVRRVATPLLSEEVPSEVVPLKNWTCPVGVPTPLLAPATVAVSDTDWPEFEGFGVVVTVVVLSALVTVTLTGADVLAAKLLPPVNWAVTELDPAGRVTFVSVATPALMGAEPSESET